MAFKNPYNILNYEGVTGAPIRALPQNFAFSLNMETWWSAVIRAREYSDFTGLDALYSYIMKSSTIVRSAIDKRLRPLKSRTFGVYINGKEDERLTNVVKDSAFVRELIYQRGMANFTFARVVGVDKNGDTFVYPLRNLDIVNKAVRKQTYNIEDVFYVKNHVNLFWMQTKADSEDMLGLLEPVSRDVINMFNAQNDWQTASQFNAYQQMVMYYEDGDEKMLDAARQAAAQVGLGTVIVSGKTTDEVSGKVQKNLELENVYGSATADTFRTFKENIEQLRASIMQLILGSSLLGMSDKNTNSERLVRAHLKLFRDITEADAMDVQDWFNKEDVKVKLAYLLKEPKLAECTFKVKPQNYIDIGDVDVYTKMLKELALTPTAEFIEKVGLSTDDVVGYEQEPNDPQKGSKSVSKVRGKANAAGGIKAMALDFAKRVLNK
ncbi:MAG: hypothetical protein IIU75_04925 [Rikenellaceae bacterium]|nr:hypothetical protein [Rikenellaceae bacterium]